MKSIGAHFRRLLKTNPGAIALVALGALVQLAFTGVSLVLFRSLFDRHILIGDKWGAARAALSIAAFQIVGSLVGLAARRASYAAIRDVVADYRRELVDRVILMPRQQSTSVDRSRLYHRLVQDTEAVGGTTSAVLNTWVASVPVIVLLLAAITWSDWRFTAVLLVLSPLLLLVEYLWRPVVRRAASRHYEKFQEFSQSAFFLTDSLDLIRMQSAEPLERQRQFARIDDVKESNFNAGWANAVADFGHGVSGFLTTGAVLAWGAWMVASSAISTGALMALYFAMVMLHERIRLLLMSYPGLLPGMRSLAEMKAVVSDGGGGGQPYSGTTRASLDAGVTVENVRFAYPGAPDRTVLDGASLLIGPGQITALMGANGTGKTTLLYLICGLYRPDAGRLLAGTVPYDKVSMEHLRSRIGVVMQSPMLFSGTLLENIAYGAAEPDPQRAWEAAEAAMAADFIAALPGGLNAMAGDRGVSLSGGQRQRIALARALYRRPRLLILDEPTNHLDAAAARELALRVRQLPQAPAVLIITHSEALARCAATVYTMSPSGAVLPQEQGSATGRA